jgi:membrane protease YdiL (CAAX protease family)
VYKHFKPIPFVKYLIKAPAYKYILIFYLPSVLLGVITTFLPETDMAGSPVAESVLLNLLIAVIVAPLIETLLFQSLIIEIICKIIKRPRKSIYISVMASSIAFALNHTYSISYFLITFMAGVILALAYYLGRYRKESAIILVFLIHSIYNLSSSIYNLIYNESVW